jgi:hypothetical protein
MYLSYKYEISKVKTSTQYILPARLPGQDVVASSWANRRRDALRVAPAQLNFKPNEVSSLFEAQLLVLL